MPRTSSAAQRRPADATEPDSDQQALSHLLIRVANDVTRLRQEVERTRLEVKEVKAQADVRTRAEARAQAQPVPQGAITSPVTTEPAAATRLFDAAGFTGYMA